MTDKFQLDGTYAQGGLIHAWVRSLHYGYGCFACNEPQGKYVTREPWPACGVFAR